jgi:hypothetical protein
LSPLYFLNADPTQLSPPSLAEILYPCVRGEEREKGGGGALEQISLMELGKPLWGNHLLVDGCILS